MRNSCSFTLSNSYYSVKQIKKKIPVRTFQTCGKALRIKYKTNEKQAERMEGMIGDIRKTSGQR